VRALQATLIVAILTATATSASGLNLKLGAQVYGVSNTLTGELPEEGNWKGRSGLGAGLVAEMNVAKDVSISFQPGYTPRNSRQEFEERNIVVGYTDYDINYVSLPLLVRVTGDPVGVRGFVTAGFEFSILVDATADGESGTEDISDDLDSTTLGALFGAGAMVPIGPNFLTFEFRYVQGLDDIVKRDGSEPEQGLSSPSIKYRGLDLLVGVIFVIGGE
jgi:hypothetical protein